MKIQLLIQIVSKFHIFRQIHFKIFNTKIQLKKKKTRRYFNFINFTVHFKRCISVSLAFSLNLN